MLPVPLSIGTNLEGGPMPGEQFATASSAGVMLDGLVDAVYDVEMDGRWKPAVAAYQHVLDQHGVQPRDAALIATHPWDTRRGHRRTRTGWVNRAGASYPLPLAAPTTEATSFDAVVGHLLARP